MLVGLRRPSSSYIRARLVTAFCVQAAMYLIVKPRVGNGSILGHGLVSSRAHQILTAGCLPVVIALL